MKTKTFKSEYIDGGKVKVTVYRNSAKFEFANGYAFEQSTFNNKHFSLLEMRLDCDHMSYYWAEKIVNWIRKN